MSAGGDIFQYLKRKFSGSVPESLKAALRPWVFRLVYPVKKGNYESSCGSSELTGLTFEQQKKPLVSIIIPAYNQLEYTLRCIYSIIKNTKGIKYEVILADDNSGDATKNINELVENLIVVRNGANLGFLKNCNNAAKRARGKYLLFLNNDTFVQENWLGAMIEPAEKDDKAGIIGSRLVFEDGRLQEAGGIVWKDASSGNYGKFMDPAMPEYNYMKEVDYVSGASMLVRAKLWKLAGGFDERYAPAYFEDADLAFEARKRGYKVLYQPASVVVHFEGMSHGTDVSKGVKKYQEINREKFRKKWAKALEKQPANSPGNIFSARDRGGDKKTMVFIDRSVPEYDRDAGGRMIRQHAGFFVKKGFNVKFIGDDFSARQPYASALQRLGVEVLYGGFYSNNWKKWFRENSGAIDYVVLSRPNIAAKYIDFIKKETKAKIIYHGHDLAYIREQRHARAGGGAAAEKKARYWKKTEYEIMLKADISLFPSAAEVALLNKDLPGVDIKLVPLYVYEGPPPAGYAPEKRKGLLFVGGFSHEPNLDGVLWFCNEVLPLAQKKLPGIKVHIAGSNPPPEVRALANESVIIEGFVPDEGLRDLYLKSRLVVAPLRFGAGLKGKIIEAMHFGVPVVTTTVGAEGIDGGLLYIADSPEGFAEQVVKNYNSRKLGVMSKKMKKYIARNFSEKALERAFQEVM